VKAAQNILTVEETDELILAACTPQDGAVEDCEVEPSEVRYFFESGATGVVNRVSGRVTMQEAS
jgi:hypothetical protein